MEGDQHATSPLNTVRPHFNPLPPCGGRHPAVRRQGVIFDFNPLPPCGGRPDAARGGSGLRYFNPLPPCGGRPLCRRVVVVGRAISIHSLRVEGDAHLPEAYKDGVEFQSTPSVWRETALRRVYPVLAAFQSTPSVWRETTSFRSASRRSLNFNPLPPCGGRLKT